MKHVCSIGSNSKNDIVIKDKTAADFHAELSMDESQHVFIKDLNTKFGTRVNGNKISLFELKAGDEIRIGFSRVDWDSVVNKWLSLIDNKENSQLEKELINDDSVFVTYELASAARRNDSKEYNPQELPSNSKMSKQPVREAANQRIFEESSEEKTKPKPPNSKENSKSESPKAQEETKIQPTQLEGNNVSESQKTENENNPDYPKAVDNSNPEPPKIEVESKQETSKAEDKTKPEPPNVGDESKPETSQTEDEAKPKPLNTEFPNKLNQNDIRNQSATPKKSITINQSQYLSAIKWLFLAIGIVITMLCMGWFIAAVLS